MKYNMTYNTYITNLLRFFAYESIIINLKPTLRACKIYDLAIILPS